MYSATEVERVTQRVLNDPQLLEFVEGMTHSSIPWEDRREGFGNDIAVIRGLAQHSLPLEEVQCPTLIMHGTADDDVPFDVAVKAHA